MTMHDAVQQYVADALPQDAGTRLRQQVERAYMAGCLEVLQRLDAGARAEAVRAEVLGWARSSIGRN